MFWNVWWDEIGAVECFGEQMKVTPRLLYRDGDFKRYCLMPVPGVELASKLGDLS